MGRNGGLRFNLRDTKSFKGKFHSQGRVFVFFGKEILEHVICLNSDTIRNQKLLDSPVLLGIFA